MLHSTSEKARSVAIASTFTAEPLLPPLAFLLREAGLNLDVSVAPYHQVLQQLLSTSSTLARRGGGANVLLVRLEDYIRDIEDPIEAERVVSETASDFAKALTGFVQRSTCSTVLHLFPPSPHLTDRLQETLRLANEGLLQEISGLTGLSLIAPDEIELVSSGARYDADSDDLGHIPFTDNHYAAIALAVCRKIHALLVPARKVLALDCDNTLWKGVVGEDGVDGIVVTPALARLQQFAVEAHSRGVLICLASKNAERDVLEVFEKRSDMPLQLSHVVAHRINWESKPQNLASLAQQLNLGLDSFVFIDDNPVECEQMQAELPQVASLLLPCEASIDDFLSHLWTFDKLTVTDEDRRRTDLYKEDIARKELERSSSNIVDFVAKLKVVIDIGKPDDSEFARLAQLTQRTNQFNFSTIRRTESELRALAARPDGSVLRVRVKDRFGDYGLVGLAVIRHDADALVVDTLLLSCRVLGRGVEHKIVEHIGRLAERAGLGSIRVPFIATSRNEPARAFADSIASQYQQSAGDQDVYCIPTSAAVAIEHRPGHDPEAVIRARDSESSTTAAQPVATDVSRRYTLLSQQLLTGENVLAALAESSLRSRSLPGKPALPTTESEQKMLTLWREILGIRDIGIDDDYAALGGTSLLAARLFSRITQQFGQRLPLTTILDHATVRKLAQVVDNGRTQPGSLIDLRRGEGIDNFFFVHDGDGETLLYGNVARRLPKHWSVFGIEPLQAGRISLAHASLEDMAAYYIGEMQKRQPRGPYHIGGMCAGGVLAYEMARQLESRGEDSGLIVLLDSARPTTPKRAGRITKQRMGRLRELFDDGAGASPVQLAGAVLRKLANAAAWESARRLRRLSTQVRFRALQAVLKRKLRWPGFVRGLTVREIYESAEARYTPRPLKATKLLLLRARAGHGGDTPFREIYADDRLGWKPVSARLVVEDVDGGHYTMLQEPFADAVAKSIARHLASAVDVQPSNADLKIRA